MDGGLHTIPQELHRKVEYRLHIAMIRKQKNGQLESYPFFAVRRGLEPLTPCVTGTYSNQLN